MTSSLSDDAAGLEFVLYGLTGSVVRTAMDFCAIWHIIGHKQRQNFGVDLSRPKVTPVRNL